jgi:hypothetical protein
LRAKRSNLGFNEINNSEIAASRKTLLAMTFQEFFSSLLKPNPRHPVKAGSFSSLLP